ncbi:MAG: hypothetical protein ACRDRG_00845 [Pseudonocardiaceae bacterium]
MTPAPTTPQTEQLRVPATQKWIPTEIRRRAENILRSLPGARCALISRRAIHRWGQRARNPVNPDFNVLDGEKQHAALIGRIDGVDRDTGEPFFIGPKCCDEPVDRSGVLVLGVNDTGVDNNSGEFLVNVVVTP